MTKQFTNAMKCVVMVLGHVLRTVYLVSIEVHTVVVQGTGP